MDRLPEYAGTTRLYEQMTFGDLREACLASKRCLAAAAPGCAGWRCTHRQLTSFGADDHLRPDCQSRHRSFCRTEDSHNLEATHLDLPQGATCTASAGNAHLRQVGHGGTAHLCILHVYMFQKPFKCTQIHAHKHCMSLPLLICYQDLQSTLIGQTAAAAAAAAAENLQAIAVRVCVP